MKVSVVDTARRWPTVLPPSRVGSVASDRRETECHDALLLLVLFLSRDGKRKTADHAGRFASRWLRSEIGCSGNVKTEGRLGTQSRSWAGSHGGAVWLDLMRVESKAFRDTSSSLTSGG